MGRPSLGLNWRRQMVLAALKSLADGAIGEASTRQVAEACRGISLDTVYNDLRWLAAHGYATSRSVCGRFKSHRYRAWGPVAGEEGVSEA